MPKNIRVQFNILNKERNFMRIYLRLVGFFIMLLVLLEVVQFFLKP